MFDLNEFFSSPNKIHHLNSTIPDATLNEDVIVGIDEAGRGPVLGPMIYSAAYYPLSLQQKLETEKFQDSKTLTEQQRSELFETINNYENLGWSATILSPIVISNSMLKRSKYNLNALSHDSAISLIKDLQEKGVQIREVYLDTVGMPEKYEAKLKQIFPEIKKIKVSKKADSIYKIVSVASICAKVIRDHIIENWKFVENIPYNYEDYGSGYPSDPKTKKFLAEIFDPIFGYPTFTRFSWSTVSKVMEEKAIACRWDDDEDDEENGDVCNQSIMDFFKNNNKKTKDKISKLKSGTFFQNNNIEQITDIGKLF